MMQRVLVLLMVAEYAGGVSLRGEGVEELGEQIEHFPPEGYGMTIDRRLVDVQEDGDGEEVLVATQLIEEYFDDADAEGVDEFPDVEIMGNVVDDEDLYAHEGWVDPEMEGKEYLRDPENEMLTDTDLLGETIVDQSHRRANTCGQGKSEYKIICKTDNYAYEFSWLIKDRGTGRNIASGPRTGTNYADGQMYSGRWCLAQGDYVFQLKDSAGDGICSGGGFGCGFCKAWLDGKLVGQVINDKSRWSVKNLNFKVLPFSPRIDGTNSGNTSGQWCRKVKSLMKPPQGTCNLPNGRRGHRVRVQVKVDKYGQETSWAIKSGGVTKMKMAAIVPANGQKVVEDCLPAGKYAWTITDIDGICCRHGKGGYTVTVDGEKIFDGGSFTKSQSYPFQLGFDWIDTMNERDCEWWWAHDYRRRDWHTRCYRGYYCNKPYRHLKWSPKLKADALDYAQRLLATCDEVGIKHDKTDQGENLAKNKGSGGWGGLYPADKVTKRFVDNEEFWGWNKNAHLTQAMWYPSRYMGCAETVKNLGGQRMCRMQVCRFAKAGNCMMGAYDSHIGNNWMKPMMSDDSPCGPMCPPVDGCYA